MTEKEKELQLNNFGICRRIFYIPALIGTVAVIGSGPAGEKKGDTIDGRIRMKLGTKGTGPKGLNVRLIQAYAETINEASKGRPERRSRLLDDGPNYIIPHT